MKAYFVRLVLSMMGRREEKRTRNSFTPLGNITDKFNARLLAGGVVGVSYVSSIVDDMFQHLGLFDSGELEQVVVQCVVWD
ncbi:hypothetical protein V1478_008750 [Vespula squamosa]|uniref:Uncharacterized protein n=1 Tax=Vespula squamosa TaxID=30214 RepID=A0ABD2AVA1_VESSQ